MNSWSSSVQKNYLLRLKLQNLFNDKFKKIWSYESPKHYKDWEVDLLNQHRQKETKWKLFLEENKIKKTNELETNYTIYNPSPDSKCLTIPKEMAEKALHLNFLP